MMKKLENIKGCGTYVVPDFEHLKASGETQILQTSAYGNEGEAGAQGNYVDYTDDSNKF